jgi:transcription antitermination factor NusG
MVVETNWYAVYTRPQWEKKVADLLTRKQIINYCPLNRVMRKWSDRRKIVHEPLFKSYVFVRISNKEMLPVLQTEGIINFVCWLKKPAVIRDEEIELIKDFLNEHTNVSLEKIDMSVNDLVRIVKGPLMEYKGKLIEINNNKVKVKLPSLGFMMIVEVEKSAIEIYKSPM